MALTLPSSDDLKDGIENGVSDVRSTYDRVMYGIKSHHDIEIFPEQQQGQEMAMQGMDDQTPEEPSVNQSLGMTD